MEMEEGSPAKALMILKESGRMGQKTPTKSPIRPPMRSRKRTRLPFSTESPESDEVQEEEEWISSPKLFSSRRKMTPSKTLPTGNLFTFAQKRIMKGLMAKLQNMLRQSNARRFVFYEWFYSNIDRALFEGENDFCICLKEHFPDLKTRQLTRAHWGIIRRLMGKPRRCSPAFFKEERDALETKRLKIRLLLQRKQNLESTDSSSFKDLPEEIPLPIVIGTKVTARLRTRNHDGLFTGQVDAVDTLRDTYRITFDREGIGTHSISDTEVMSNEGHETISLSSLIVKERVKAFINSTPPRIYNSTSSVQDALNNGVGSSTSPSKDELANAIDKGEQDGTYGGFPIGFLIQVTRLSKILTRKRKQIKVLKELNHAAERLKSYEQPFTRDFQQEYASVVLELDKINKELYSCLQGVQDFCQKISPDIATLSVNDQPSTVRSQCFAEASSMIAANPRSANVHDERIKDLISGLASLMLQVKNLAGNNMKSFELTSINEAMDEIKTRLFPANKSVFFDKVEVNIAHIQSGLSQMGNVNAFQTNMSSTFT